MPDISIQNIEVSSRKRELSESKIGGIAESISLLGLLNPITLVKNGGDTYRLIAGLHRLQAFKDLGRETIPARVFDFDWLLGEIAEISENLNRSELSVIEEAEFILQLDTLLDALGQRAKRGNNRFTIRGETSARLKTNKDLATSLGITARSYQQKRQIGRDLTQEVRDLLKKSRFATATSGLVKLSKESPEIQLKVARKLVESTNQGEESKRIRAEIDGVKREEEQSRLLKSRSGKVSLEDYGITLHQGDFRKLANKVPDDSIRMIYTDPPYDQDSKELYRDVGVLAKDKLMDGGCLLIYTPSSYIADVLDMIRPNLDYHWQCIITSPGFHGVFHPIGVVTQYKSILMFVKGKRKRGKKYFYDKVNDSKPEKVVDNWEQGLAAPLEYIEYLTELGDTILDPLLGTGTFLIGAMRMGRKGVGFEKVKQTFRIAQKRLEGEVGNRYESV